MGWVSTLRQYDGVSAMTNDSRYPPDSQAPLRNSLPTRREFYTLSSFSCITYPGGVLETQSSVSGSRYITAVGFGPREARGILVR
jgi:hypothetical protein